MTRVEPAALPPMRSSRGTVRRAVVGEDRRWRDVVVVDGARRARPAVSTPRHVKRTRGERTAGRTDETPVSPALASGRGRREDRVARGGEMPPSWPGGESHGVRGGCWCWLLVFACEYGSYRAQGARRQGLDSRNGTKISNLRYKNKLGESLLKHPGRSEFSADLKSDGKSDSPNFHLGGNIPYRATLKRHYRLLFPALHPKATTT